MVETALVTGAAGFVGWHVCRRLLSEGYHVRGLDNFDPFYDRVCKETNVRELAASPGFEFREGDVRASTDVQGALENVTVVVHLAARPGVRPSLEAAATYLDINTGGTRALLTACRTTGVRRFVLASSSSVYGRGTPLPFREDRGRGAPASPYAASKAMAEDLVADAERAGFRAAILRLFSVYGSRMRPDLAMRRFAAQLAAHQPVTVFGDGRSVRDYTHASDVAHAATLAVRWTADDAPACEVLNIGSGRPVALDCVVSQLAAVSGMSPTIQRVPEHPADLPATWADTTKARSVLGFEASVDLDVGLRDLVTWHEAVYGR